MPHEIDITTGRPAIAYTGETPWHGLGIKVNEAMVSEDAIKLGGLDWLVFLAPVYGHNFDGEGYSEIEGYHRLIREDTRTTLSIVGNKYTPLQNRDAFKLADSLIENGLRYDVVGSLQGGRRIWLLAKLPDQIRVIGHDVLDNYLLLTSSHDGSQTVKISLTPIRVVCMNTLRQAEVSADYLLRAKHTSSVHATVARKLRPLFVNIQAWTKGFTEECQLLACKSVNDREIDTFLRELLGYQAKDLNVDNSKDDLTVRAGNMIETIKELHAGGKGSDIPGVRGSLWGVFNAVAEYTDHLSSVKGEDKTEARLSSIWFGTGARLKEKAFQKALELAKV